MKGFKLSSLLLILLITVLVSIALGSIRINVITIMRIFFDTHYYNAAQEAIILKIRLPRVLLAMMVGGCLGTSGCIMQGLFRNPMADPFILGVSSGAGVGAAVAIVSGLALTSIYFVPLLAFFFSTITICAVYTIAQTNGTMSVETLLLSGIAMSTFLSAVLSFLIYVSEKWLHSLYFWLMGGFGTASWTYVFLLLPFTGGGIMVSLLFSRDLNAILLGEETAQHLGVEVDAVKRVLVVMTSLMTGAAVSVSGIIGFVGLVVPHMVRIIVGPDHRILLPSSAVLGGIFMIWADNVARTVISPSELPVGVVTAFFGAPFFIYLLRKKRGDMFAKG
ncbi:MAG: iron chelate uptake ABC transporter family permease subunit [Theionarchaea archaeon]|nr:iron chelate uptake ABC transporter family permease subunit [Theionarchaea archaeon]